MASKNFNKGTLGAMLGSGCGPLVATPIFLEDGDMIIDSNCHNT